MLYAFVKKFLSKTPKGGHHGNKVATLGEGVSFKIASLTARFLLFCIVLYCIVLLYCTLVIRFLFSEFHDTFIFLMRYGIILLQTRTKKEKIQP